MEFGTRIIHCRKCGIKSYEIYREGYPIKCHNFKNSKGEGVDCGETEDLIVTILDGKFQKSEALEKGSKLLVDTFNDDCEFNPLG